MGDVAYSHRDEVGRETIGPDQQGAINSDVHSGAFYRPDRCFGPHPPAHCRRSAQVGFSQAFGTASGSQVVQPSVERGKDNGQQVPPTDGVATGL